MKILFIEDDPNKYEAINNFILSNYPDIDLTLRKSYRSGAGELQNAAMSYDLLFLDMSLPVFDESIQASGGRFLAQGGKDILIRMKSKGIYTKVIVITQFEEFDGITITQLDNELRKRFPDLYLGYVYYSAIQVRWKEKLSQVLQKWNKYREF